MGRPSLAPLDAPGAGPRCAALRRPRRPRTALAVALLALLPAGPAFAQTLLGVGFEGSLVDVDAATGTASSPRPVQFAGSTPLAPLAGIEAADDGTVYVVVSETPAASALESALYRVEPGTGSATLVGAVGRQVGEGDLALDPSSGDLYAIGLTDLTAPFTLLRIDPESGAGSVVGTLEASDVSALAFGADGSLYAVDTSESTLLRLSPTTAQVLGSVALTQPLGAVAGMDLDPGSGTLFVADGGSGGNDALFALDPATGTLDPVGALGLASGLAGLAVVPEPAAAGLGALAALAALARRRAGPRV